MKSSKEKTGLIVFIAILLVGVASLVYGVSNKVSNATEANKGSNKSFSSLVKKSQAKDYYIACLYITGTIEESNDEYDQKWLLETIDTLQNDDFNVGTILYINSPGGAVYQTDDVYLRLLEYKEEKPLYAYMGQMAASGGYYIPCAASYIMANRNTLTGSIGVIMGQFIDLSELMQKYGIKSETIHAGRNKAMGSYTKPLTDEQRAIMQSIADECYNQFTDIVSKSRHLTKQKTIELADGRVYSAQQAVKNGLIDEIGTWEDIVNKMEETEFEGDTFDVIDFKYEGQKGFYKYLLGSAEKLSKSLRSSFGLPSIVEEAITPKTPYPAYYCNF